MRVLNALTMIDRTLVSERVINVDHVVRVRTRTVRRTAMVLMVLVRRLHVALTLDLTRPILNDNRQVRTRMNLEVIMVEIVIYLMVNVNEGRRCRLINALCNRLSALIEGTATLISNASTSNVLRVIIVRAYVPRRAILTIDRRLTYESEIEHVERCRVLLAEAKDLVSSDRRVN